jgi:hypothetical protein
MLPTKPVVYVGMEGKSRNWYVLVGVLFCGIGYGRIAYLFAHNRWRRVDFDGCADAGHFEVWWRLYISERRDDGKMGYEHGVSRSRIWSGKDVWSLCLIVYSLFP